MLKIAMYMRLSLEDEKEDGSLVESNSIANQRYLIKEFIHNTPELQKCEVREYYDDGFSGTNFDRPSVTKLLEDVKRNMVNCIIVKDFSRFSRDYIEMGSYLDQIFPFMGVRFIAVNDNYDSKDHKGTTSEIDIAFKTLLYDFYSKDLSVKLRTSFANKYAEGEYVCGNLPLGYEKVPGLGNVLRINKKEAKIVERIFALSVQGNSTVQIAKTLYEEDVPTWKTLRHPNSKRTDGNPFIWTATSVRKILKNRFYIGEMSYNKSNPVTVGSKKINKLAEDEWIIVPNHHEPIVSEEVFHAVTIGEGRSTKRMRPKNPLTGKLVCGGCGYSMSYKPNKKRGIPRFECRMHAQLQITTCCPYIRADMLEELVLTMLNKELMQAADLDKGANGIKDFLKQRMNQLKGQIAENKVSITTMEHEKQLKYEEYVLNAIDAATYKECAADLDARITKASEKMKLDNDKLFKTEDEYISSLDDMKQVLKYGQVDVLTEEVVNTFINKIKVYQGKRVEIEWKFSDPYTQNCVSLT